MNIYHTLRYTTSSNITDLHIINKAYPINKLYSFALVAKKQQPWESLITPINSSEIVSNCLYELRNILAPNSHKKPLPPLILARFRQFCFSVTIYSQCWKPFQNHPYSASVGSLLIQIPRGSFGYSYILRNMLYNLLSWNSRYFLLSSNTFSIPLQRSLNGEDRHINEKVLLKLSSTFKLRNFDAGTKMIAIAPHHLIYTYLRRSEYYQIGVGYCFIRAKVMRRPECRIKQI